ncbi:PilZ domain-containing protein [Rhizobium sp. SL42]|uniref:PilZ domain-containing protein n=1 Tax=Rhizobium sp. SL42 TaxID=2806346 RepID=UPI001F1C04BB|nr:PilZ domain-containing protein [Rhizobium sp. SL42]UJW73474.1 PilZ domain-containing protein [Rhizobium sp. SL42]
MLAATRQESFNTGQDGRQTQRLRCRFKGTLDYLGHQIDIRVIDISRTGMALQLEGWIEAKRGSTVTVRTTELGLIEGTVRWYRAGKMGLEFEKTSNTLAQISAYFRHFHRDPGHLSGR